MAEKRRTIGLRDCNDLRQIRHASRDLADKLKPLLGENGVPFTWPLVIWQSRDGTLEAAAGDAPKTWTYMRRDLGAP